MANVYKCRFHITAGDRSSTQSYWNTATSLDAAEDQAKKLAGKIGDLLGGDALQDGIRINEYDNTTFKPTGAGRTLLGSATPSTYTTSDDQGQLSTQGEVALINNVSTASNYKGKVFIQGAPQAVTSYFRAINAGGTPDADGTVTEWKIRFRTFSTHLQTASNKWAIKAKNRSNFAPASGYQIVNVDSATIGAGSFLQFWVSGNQVGVFTSGLKIQVKGYRLQGSRKRPGDGMYQVNASSYDSDANVTKISVFCSNPSLADGTPCSYGRIYIVAYLLDAIIDSARFDDLVLSSRRRGNAPFVPHRGTAKSRACSA